MSHRQAAQQDSEELFRRLSRAVVAVLVVKCSCSEAGGVGLAKRARGTPAS